MIGTMQQYLAAGMLDVLYSTRQVVKGGAEMGPEVARPLAAVACLGLAALALATPAEATFPGRNGGIAFGQRTGTGDSERHSLEHRRLATAPPGVDEPRILLDCELTEGVPRGGDCTVTSYQTPSYSPDGRMLVFDAGERLAVIDAGGGGRLFLLPAASAD
jgi:hypothetical protein